jgi:hypothetical protein
MGRSTYIPENEEIWLEYFFTQAGQVGHGGLGGFQGIPYQRGHGLGSFFARLFRAIMPVAKRVGKSALKTVGKEALAMGANVAGDVVKGKHFEEAMETHGRQAAGNILDKASASIRKAQQVQSGGNIGQRSVVSTTSSVKRKQKPATKKRRSKKRKIDYWD